MFVRKVLSPSVFFLLCLRFGGVQSRGRNIVITADGVAVATAADGGRQLVTVDVRTSQETTHRFNNNNGLPRAVNGFDDVAVDPEARARDSSQALVFAIDAESGLVCSCEYDAPEGG